MKKTGNVAALLVVIGLLVGLGYFLAAHHIANTRKGMRLYPKEELTMADTFADLTAMTAVQMAHHRGLARAVANAGDAELLPGGKTAFDIMEGGGTAIDALKRVFGP
jgi:hypothetical protein